jgi:hypothetical protein
MTIAPDGHHNDHGPHRRTGDGPPDGQDQGHHHEVGHGGRAAAAERGDHRVAVRGRGRPGRSRCRNRVGSGRAGASEAEVGRDHERSEVHGEGDLDKLGPGAHPAT